MGEPVYNEHLNDRPSVATDYGQGRYVEMSVGHKEVTNGLVTQPGSGHGTDMSKPETTEERMDNPPGGDLNNESLADERVVINVSGVKFETRRSTLERSVRCNLSYPEFRAKYYCHQQKEYFFDRDPDMFKCVLNYVRTGELHLPSYICGPAAKIEIRFWGIPSNMIERCCWINYNEWNSTQQALTRLEHDRKVHVVDDSSDNTRWQRWRPIVWKLLNNSNTFWEKVVGIVSLGVVVLSIFSFLAETTEYFSGVTKETPIDTVPLGTVTITTPYTGTAGDRTTKTMPQTTPSDETEIKNPTLFVIDIFCLAYFCLEYIVRMIFAPNRLKNAKSILSVIDLIAIIPDFIEIIMYSVRPDLRQNTNAVTYITLLRVIRVLRIFRLVRHSAGLWILIYTLRASVNELILLFWFMALGVLVFSSLIYYVEDKDRFQSIPDGFWWSLITMTTVGYGDMYPVTVLGKIVGSCCAMCGVLMVGFTVPALVNNFMLYYRHIQFAMHVEKQEELERQLSNGSSALSNSISQTGATEVETMNNNKLHVEGIVIHADQTTRL